MKKKDNKENSEKKEKRKSVGAADLKELMPTEN